MPKSDHEFYVWEVERDTDGDVTDKTAHLVATVNGMDIQTMGGKQIQADEDLISDVAGAPPAGEYWCSQCPWHTQLEGAHTPPGFDLKEEKEKAPDSATENAN